MFSYLRGLRRQPDFAKLWAGQTVSAFGSMFGALSLTALVYLHATPVQLGLLAMAQGLPVPLFALSAGVWVDRLPLRPILFAADAGRAVALLTVPAVAMFGTLHIEQLYAVAFVFGLLEVVFDIAYRSYLPALVPPDELLDANAKLSASESVAEIGSPAVGGAVVQAAGGPGAVFIDALTFLWSAACVVTIRHRDGRARPIEQPNMLAEVVEGLRAVWHDRILRALTAANGTGRFFGGFYQALYALFLIRTLGFSPFVVGITVGAGGIGSLGGSLLAGRMTRRLGVGRTLVISKLVPIGVLIPLAGGPAGLAFAMVFAAQLFGDPFWATYEITSISLRQSITPERLLGRVTSTMYLVQSSLLPIGALVAGVLAQSIGVRETLWLAEIGGMLAAAWLLFSPIPRVRDLNSAS